MKLAKALGVGCDAFAECDFSGEKKPARGNGAGRRRVSNFLRHSIHSLNRSSAIIDSEIVRDALATHAEATEVYEMKSFRCHRASGTITVNVCDSGIEDDHHRYWIQVLKDGVSVGRGSGGPDVDTTIAIFHWSAVDAA